MSADEIVRHRLHNQRLTGTPFERAEEAVRWLGAVQAQDFAGAAWGLALRCRNVTAADVDRALAEGLVLRTHVMRPTWHLVVPEDIRWLLQLTAARVHALNASLYRRLELDEPVLRRSTNILVAALRDGQQRTRAELAGALERGGIAATGVRLAMLLMHAELEAVICSGAPRGKQQTYALLDERAPRARTLSREEALGELAARYFVSHGPATARDFAWWSGLTVADARAGVELIGSRLTVETMQGKHYWRGTGEMPGSAMLDAVHLLPNFDEYLVAYADRSAALDDAVVDNAAFKRAAFMGHSVAVDGRVVGDWRRTILRAEVRIQANLLVALDDRRRERLEAEVARYGRFLGRRAVIE
jgi:hypothetical protein